MKRPVVAVFCSSRERIDQVYPTTARELGEMLGRAGYDLVWGGCADSSMKGIADGILAGGGRAYAVVPMARANRAYREASETIWVRDLAQRKEQMKRRADAFVVLPGGIGTLDECFDVLAHQAIVSKGGNQVKPTVIFDQQGIYGALELLMNQLVATGMIPPELQRLYRFVSVPQDVIQALQDHFI